MDFKKIEQIFIIVFLSLDLFLLFNYKENGEVQSNTNRETSAKNVLSEMRRDNITVPKVSNSKNPKGYLIAYSNNDPNNIDSNNMRFKPTTVKLRVPISVTPRNAVRTITKFIDSTSLISNKKDYVYCDYLSTYGKTIVFVQKFKDNLIYDSSGQLSFDIKGNLITSFQKSHLDNLSQSKETENVWSEQEAVIRLYTLNQIPNNTKIIWSKLAYSWLLDAKHVSVYVPTWFIALENKKTQNITILKINAFSGALLKANL